MPDAEWVENLKSIALRAVEAGGPCDIVGGTVESTAPLSVRIDQKTLLTGPQLLLTRNVTEHTEEMVLPKTGETTVLVKAGLKAGDRVLLLQKRGGQQYAVMDRW